MNQDSPIVHLTKCWEMPSAGDDKAPIKPKRMFKRFPRPLPGERYYGEDFLKN
jgi:hypothetical protein